jgi:hypothetical protein
MKDNQIRENHGFAFPRAIAALPRITLQPALRSKIYESPSLCLSNSPFFFISSLFGRGYYRSTAAEALRNGRTDRHISKGLTVPAYFGNRSRLRAPARF